jgi:Holliday junction resolvasome RuvABC endonuclease subunit
MPTPLSDALFRIRIIGIDPGSTELGLCILDFDIRTMKILFVKPFTVYVDKLSQSETLIRTRGARFARLTALRATLFDVFTEHMPQIIVSEAPFYNPRMPGAFAPLVETMDVITRAVNDYDPVARLDTLAPSIVKKGVESAAGSNNKDLVRDALQKIPDLTLDAATVARLSTHATDATAVAYTRYRLCACKVKE